MDERGSASLLAGYDPKGFFCEMLGGPGAPDTCAAPVWQRIGELGLDELHARSRDAEPELYNFGITFTVYTEKDAIGRILPFDVIPRVISPEDWHSIETDVTQRVKAINLFLWDVYHDQKILGQGVVPRASRTELEACRRDLAADQTTRLLDVKYHLLPPNPMAVGSPVDVSQWNALLRSASGYHAFRRVHPSGMDPAAVAGFLLFHDSFPRSVADCVAALGALLSDLSSRCGLVPGDAARAEVAALRASLDEGTIERVVTSGLHEYIDWIQLALMAVTSRLGEEFFGTGAGQAEGSAGALEA